MAALSTALRGMPGCRADFTSWANVNPPTAFTSASPNVPSDPVPDRTTATARACWSSASDRNRKSIGRCGPRPSPRGVTANTPWAIAMFVSGGMT